MKAKILVSLLMGVMVNDFSSANELVVLDEIFPSCGSKYYKFENAACVVTPDSPADLSEKKCNLPGLKFANDKCERTAIAPNPTCGTAIPDLAFDPTSKKCVVDRRIQRSSSGNYVGDCFRITAVPEVKAGFPWSGGERLVALHQRDTDGDAMLTVVESKSKYLWFGCAPKNGSVVHDVRASDLERAGASRYGWTYGVLVLPFKYYRHSSGFSSGLSFGPYLGRRYGMPGSAFTVAAGVALSSVKGEVKDSAGSITDTPDLQALSATIGVMWDISKKPGIKPFKIGVFYGADRVNQGDVIKYVNNKKPWLAFQVGFDFTDN